MGVFDRFFRRKDEVAAEEVAVETLTAESVGADEAKGRTVVVEAPAEAVEIPKQQSADVAADSEAGDGART